MSSESDTVIEYSWALSSNFHGFLDVLDFREVTETDLLKRHRLELVEVSRCGLEEIAEEILCPLNTVKCLLREEF